MVSQWIVITIVLLAATVLTLQARPRCEECKVRWSLSPFMIYETMGQRIMMYDGVEVVIINEHQVRPDLIGLRIKHGHVPLDDDRILELDGGMTRLGSTLSLVLMVDPGGTINGTLTSNGKGHRVGEAIDG